MNIANRVANAIIRGIFRITCRIDKRELSKVPLEGPFILITNHISAFEGPLLYLFLRPRNTIALAKRELWKNPFTRKLMEWWQCIPVDREQMDRKALSGCFSTLDHNDILCIAPEGTRSKDGALKQGKAGTTFIAAKKRVPILPVANYGMESFTSNLKHLQRTDVIFKVGDPFVISTDKRRFSNEERQQITDEMMLRIARLLPESYRGFYQDKGAKPFVFTTDVQ